MERKLANICLDMSPVVHRKAGMASYAMELAVHLLTMDRSNDYSVFHYGAHPAASLPPELAGLPRRIVPLSARPWRLSVAARFLAGRSMDGAFQGVDIFHATENLLPPLRRVKTVFTFHDAIYALFPQFHLPMNRLYLGLMMPRFLKRADSIIAISDCSKRDAVRLYGIAPERIRVIYEGVDRRFRPADNAQAVAEVRKRLGLPEHYLLTVGTIEPRKNLTALLEAYLVLLQVGAGQGIGAVPRLVIVGKKGWLYEGFFRRLRQLGLESHVVLPGYVPDADLPVLYAGADCFVFPSLYEGFGLPPLEALACGTPVVCSDASSLPEVVGDAALSVDPSDVRGLATAMGRVLADAGLRQEMRGRGLERAAQFTWERTARETLEVYGGLLGTRREGSCTSSG